MRTSFFRLTLLALRLWTGLNFVFAHGLPKARDPETFLQQARLESFPWPTFSGWAAIVCELLGGILLTLGLFTRAGAAMILAVMLGAALVFHAEDPWGRREFPLTYAFVALLLLAHGGGWLSVDQWLDRNRKKRKPW